MSTYCPACQREIELDDPFCRHCGQAQSNSGELPAKSHWEFRPTVIGIVLSLLLTWVLLRWLHWPGLILLGVFPFWWRSRRR